MANNPFKEPATWPAAARIHNFVEGGFEPVEEAHENDEDNNDIDPSGEGTGEATGRWSSQEHQLFLQGLELYGKGWKKIANVIRTRTVVQIRTHAQKYFQKLAKSKLGDYGEGLDSSLSLSSGSRGLGVAGSRRPRARRTKARRERLGGFEPGLLGVKGADGVSPSLKPYLALPGVRGSVEAGLYRYLSPVVVDGKAPTVLQSELEAAAAAADTTSCCTSSFNGTCNGNEVIPKSICEMDAPKPTFESGPSSVTGTTTTSQSNDLEPKRELEGLPPRTIPLDASQMRDPVAPNLSDPAPPPSFSTQGVHPAPMATNQAGPVSGMPVVVCPVATAHPTPEWYARGAGMPALLAQAETIDWLADTGGEALPLHGKVSHQSASSPASRKLLRQQQQHTKASSVAETAKLAPTAHLANETSSRPLKSRAAPPASPPRSKRGATKARGKASNRRSGVKQRKVTHLDSAPKESSSLSADYLDVLASVSDEEGCSIELIASVEESNEDQVAGIADLVGLDIDHSDFDSAALFSWSAHSSAHGRLRPEAASMPLV